MEKWTWLSGGWRLTHNEISRQMAKTATTLPSVQRRGGGGGRRTGDACERSGFCTVPRLPFVLILLVPLRRRDKYNENTHQTGHINCSCTRVRRCLSEQGFRLDSTTRRPLELQKWGEENPERNICWGKNYEIVMAMVVTDDDVTEPNRTKTKSKPNRTNGVYYCEQV